MRATILLAGLIASLTAASATAQPAHRGAAPVLAEFLLNAMPITRYGWAREWRTVAIYARPVRWHMTTPEDAAKDPDGDGVYRRVGWLEGDGASIHVTACGDTKVVRGFAASTSHAARAYHSERPRPEIGEALAAELKARNVTATERARTRDRADYLLAAPERDPGVLSISTTCVPDGSRAGPGCEIHYQLVLRADYRPGGRSLPGEACHLPRWR